MNDSLRRSPTLITTSATPSPPLSSRTSEVAASSAPPTSPPPAKQTSPPAAPNAATSTVKRACDACHRRKVKCIGDGTRSCKNCTSAGLTCTYNAIPQKKGPKGSRAKVISELRETQRLQLVARRKGLESDSPPHSPAYLRKAGLLSPEMITACLDNFFEHLYPTQPILHRAKVSEAIGLMEHNLEIYCLIVSLCAYMMIQPNMVIPPGAFDGLDIPPQPSLQLGRTLLQEAILARRESNYVENPSTASVITSFFFFGSYFCLDMHNTAWFHLREATTLAQILGMHEESTYNSLDVIESSRRRRLYWLLFVTERAYALQQHKPLTLYATINLPTLDEDPAETVALNGFIHLVNLFRPFDDTFVGLWNKSQTECSTEWLANLQSQLSKALPVYLHCTESQAVDLRCSQQWLRTMVWQLSISHGFLSSAASDNALSFRFPIEVSRDLVQAASQFTKQAMEVHGIGLIEKLFDIACTLTDVMSVLPDEQYTFEFGPRDYLCQLMSLISSLRGGHERYWPLLMRKINDTVPNSPGYQIQITPEEVNSKKYFDDRMAYPTLTRSLPSSLPNSVPSSGCSTPFISNHGVDGNVNMPSFSYAEMIASGALRAPTSSTASSTSTSAASSSGIGVDGLSATSHPTEFHSTVTIPMLGDHARYKNVPYE